jgi:hypothetical protein
MATSLIHKVIAQARDLISEESCWVQIRPAVSSDGLIVLPDSPGAVRFCATGALLRAAFELTGNLGSSDVLCDRAGKRLVPAGGMRTNPIVLLALDSSSLRAGCSEATRRTRRA